MIANGTMGVVDTVVNGTVGAYNATVTGAESLLGISPAPKDNAASALGMFMPLLAALPLLAAAAL